MEQTNEKELIGVIALLQETEKKVLGCRKQERDSCRKRKACGNEGETESSQYATDCLRNAVDNLFFAENYIKSAISGEEPDYKTLVHPREKHAPKESFEMPTEIVRMVDMIFLFESFSEELTNCVWRFCYRRGYDDEEFVKAVIEGIADSEEEKPNPSAGERHRRVIRNRFMAVEEYLDFCNKLIPPLNVSEF